jgi:excisionase family DNA binding protein
MKALHDVKNAAVLLAVSPWTVRAYIRAGKLKPIRLGRLVRLDEEEIQRFVREAAGTNPLPEAGQ